MQHPRWGPLSYRGLNCILNPAISAFILALKFPHYKTELNLNFWPFAASGVIRQCSFMCEIGFIFNFRCCCLIKVVTCESKVWDFLAVPRAANPISKWGQTTPDHTSKSVSTKNPSKCNQCFLKNLSLEDRFLEKRYFLVVLSTTPRNMQINFLMLAKIFLYWPTFKSTTVIQRGFVVTQQPRTTWLQKSGRNIWTGKGRQGSLHV